MSGGSDIRSRLDAALTAGPVADVNAALSETEDVWLVGGTIRDILLARELTDVDLAVGGDVKSVARALHERFRGDIFSLSERFGTWRISPAAGDWQIDLTALRGETIERDLALRDFTINAMALPLGATARAAGRRRERALPIDPTGGHGDLAAKTLRVTGAGVFIDDPLRLLRLARLAVVLGFDLDPETARLSRAQAGTVTQAAAERAFAELRGLVTADDAVGGISLLDELGLLAALLPELTDLRGVEQSVYHHLDAYQHTIEVLERLVELVADPADVFGDDADELSALLDRPLADEMTSGQALRFAVLMHDIAKRRTRTVFDDGRVGFPGHDREGARMAREICRRFNVSDRFTRFVTTITGHHLDLGFLVHERPLPPRRVYRYLRGCEPVEVEVGVLSVADRLATRGRKSGEAIERHLQLARELNRAALDWRAG
ncbi:MAG: HD domain-containing protein, partial [Solirubrobacterales bacterium]